MTIPITPQNTIITFDLHQVIMQHDFKSMFLAWWNAPRNLLLVMHLVHPKILLRVLKLRRSGAVAEKVLNTLLEEFPHLRPFQALAFSMLNAQKPIQETVALLKTLKDKGYSLHIFSNIGEHLFRDLQRKNPELFNLFDTVHTTRRTNDYLPKPQKQAFLDYLICHVPSNKQVIFVDDRHKNLIAAQECGIIGIRFTNPKQLAGNLVSLGVLREK